MPTRKTPTILVVGGGFAGRAAVRYLLDLHEAAPVHIVLVDDKAFFEFTPALPRCIIDPSHLASVTFPHASDDTIYFVQGRVTHLTDAEAAVERRLPAGNTVISIPFDYCIWAPGLGYTHPFRSSFRLNLRSVPRRRADLYHFRTRLLDAEHVLIIGAGPVGVELAAELSYLSRTEVPFRLTLAASPNGLLPRLPPPAGRYAQRWLQAHGVNVLVARLKPHHHQQGPRHDYRDPARGITVTPDVAIDCTGPRPNNSVLALVAGGLVSRASILFDGALMVEPTLQLTTDSNVFAAGDAARVPGELSTFAAEKTAYGAEQAGILAARNVARLMREQGLIRKRVRPLLTFPTDAFPLATFPRLFVVSLHRRHAILCVGPLVLCGMLPAAVKLLIEVLGVPAARADGPAAILLKVIERLSFVTAAVLQKASVWFRRVFRRPARGTGAATVNAHAEAEVPSSPAAPT